MAMNLHYVFSRRAMWCTHGNEQGLVKAVTCLGVNNVAEIEMMRLQCLSWMGKEKSLARNSLCVGTTYPNDRHPPMTRRSGNRSNRVMFVHRLRITCRRSSGSAPFLAACASFGNDRHLAEIAAAHTFGGHERVFL